MQLIFTEQTSRVGSPARSLHSPPLWGYLSRSSLSWWPVCAERATGEGGDRLTPGRPFQQIPLLSRALLFRSSAPQGWTQVRLSRLDWVSRDTLCVCVCVDTGATLSTLARESPLTHSFSVFCQSLPHLSASTYLTPDSLPLSLALSLSLIAVCTCVCLFAFLCA